MANYLYNGVELPDINTVWTDKATYPYACITRERTNATGARYLYLSSAPFIVNGNGNGIGIILDNGTIVNEYCTQTDTYEWTESGTFSAPDLTEPITQMIIEWTSHDVYDEGGILYLAASDPVPLVATLPPTDLYKKIGGQYFKHTLYKKLGGKLVKVDGNAVTLVAQEPEQPETDPLPAVGTSLEDCTWEQISAISAAGKAAEYFSVGDTKSVYLKGTVGTLELDTTLYVYILGFDHNSEVEGKGITFGTFKTADGVDVALIDSKYGSTDTSGTKYFTMAHWGTSNNGGWSGANLRYDILSSTDKAPSGYGMASPSGNVGYDPSATCVTSPVASTLMAALPAELRAVMKPITKYTNNEGGSGDTANKVTVTTDYLPLLAEFEIFGIRTHANSAEQNNQKQYDYYAAGNSKVKYRHSDTSSASIWWERSAYYGNGTRFCVVGSSGTASRNNCYYSQGIAPIFLV